MELSNVILLDISVLISAIEIVVLLVLCYFFYLKIRENHFKYGMIRKVLIILGIMFLTNAIGGMFTMYHMILYLLRDTPPTYAFLVAIPGIITVLPIVAFAYYIFVGRIQVSEIISEEQEKE